MKKIVTYSLNFIADLGHSLNFLLSIFWTALKGRIRWAEVFKQVYEQGVNSIVIIALTSLASGLVLAMQSYVVLVRFGAKEFIAPLVALSLVRELGPIFTALIFSGKAGARITAELGTMNVNDQILATRTLGVDPIEYFVLPRMLGCMLVLPVLTILAELIGIYGGYLIGVYEAGIPKVFYMNQTFRSIQFTDFNSGFIKVFFFALLIGWVCCYQGFVTRGGSIGVGKYTTKAVALSYILIIVSNTILTKIILTFWP